MTLSVDSTAYTSGAEVQLNEGLHSFQCVASNAELDTTIAWEFNASPIAPSTTASFPQNANLQNIQSIVSNYQVSGDDCGITVRCSVVSLRNPNARGLLAAEVFLKVNSKYAEIYARCL